MYINFSDSCSKACFEDYDPEKAGDKDYQRGEFVPGIPRDFNPIRKLLLDDILGAIGRTPLVRLNKIPKSLGIECEVCKFSAPVFLCTVFFVKVFEMGNLFYLEGTQIRHFCCTQFFTL